MGNSMDEKSLQAFIFGNKKSTQVFTHVLLAKL